MASTRNQPKVVGKLLTDLWFYFVLALLPSLVVSGLIGHIAVDHNPMGAYCEFISDIECRIIWENLAPLVFIWFSLSFIVVITVLLIIGYLFKKWGSS